VEAEVETEKLKGRERGNSKDSSKRIIEKRRGGTKVN
jgi:hypothetical protein